MIEEFSLSSAFLVNRRTRGLCASKSFRICNYIEIFKFYRMSSMFFLPHLMSIMGQVVTEATANQVIDTVVSIDEPRSRWRLHLLRKLKLCCSVVDLSILSLFFISECSVIKSLTLILSGLVFKFLLSSFSALKF